MAKLPDYGEINTTFSGADAVATFTPVGGKPIVFGEIQTISYSIYRPTTPVYTLGRINPKGVVKGQRTIAGSIIFTVFDRHVLKNLMDSYIGDDGLDVSMKEIKEMRKHMKTDEMPPLTLQFT